MVDRTVAKRAMLDMPPLSAPEEQALRTVPRELFLPGLELTDVYAEQAVVTKRDQERGVALSSVSAPAIIATMLHRADIRPGHRILEIGSGGYNAALIRELTGAGGDVTSIDIDPEVVDRAGRFLDHAGYRDVHVAAADGEHGFARRAPYDRILVTAGAWDVPPAWRDQLAPGGRMVVPMRIRGLTRCLTLERAAEGHWSCVAVDMCGFVRMQGAGEHWEPMPYLNDEPDRRVGLRLEDGPSADVAALRRALAREPDTVWSGVLVQAEEPTDDQDLWIATAADEWALLTADREAIRSGLVTPTWALGTPTLLNADGTGFAYRTLRRHPTREGRWEFGAIGHGPQARATAERLCDLMAAWDRDLRGRPGPEITLHPVSKPDHRLPAGRVIDKRSTRMVLNWTATTEEEKKEEL
ncbi:protein-L-isoaspartate(D-aspartate) O-methyltransferase [Streptomonospora salina]|uniref:Protein-L-isoaspartate O-methyltransferase n=2 Tax=Streptomonospora salina TaxID=104205 RepID=A0A841EB16_9ACTN|nr:protein-L-isoaspartate(D-aspartate) O-methyltransferase [Streptomonospora salina]